MNVIRKQKRTQSENNPFLAVGEGFANIHWVSGDFYGNHVPHGRCTFTCFVKSHVDDHLWRASKAVAIFTCWMVLLPFTAGIFTLFSDAFGSHDPSSKGLTIIMLSNVCNNYQNIRHFLQMINADICWKVLVRPRFCNKYT